MLVDNVTNLNTETVICKAPPTKLLPNRPSPTEAVHNVYELKTVPEKIRYFHVCAGFPTKHTWMKAIKKGFFCIMARSNRKSSKPTLSRVRRNAARSHTKKAIRPEINKSENASKRNYKLQF